jgi:hypothetical protein
MIAPDLRVDKAVRRYSEARVKKVAGMATRIGCNFQAPIS